MEQHPTGSIPAGWYADPSGQFTARWWDGQQWTDQVRPAAPPPAGPAASGAPVVSPAPPAPNAPPATQAPSTPPAPPAAHAPPAPPAPSGPRQGLVIGVVLAVVVLLAGIAAAVLLLRGSDDLQAGACILMGPQLRDARSLAEAERAWEAEDYEVVGCDQPHHWEIMHVFDERDLERYDLFAGDFWDVDDVCVDELFPRYVGIEIDDSRWDIEVLDLTQISNERRVQAGIACILYDWRSDFEETVSVPARDSRQ